MCIVRAEVFPDQSEHSWTSFLVHDMPLLVRARIICHHKPIRGRPGRDIPLSSYQKNKHCSHFEQQQIHRDTPLETIATGVSLCERTPASSGNTCPSLQHICVFSGCVRSLVDVWAFWATVLQIHQLMMSEPEHPAVSLKKNTHTRSLCSACHFIIIVVVFFCSCDWLLSQWAWTPSK